MVIVMALGVIVLSPLLGLLALLFGLVVRPGPVAIGRGHRMWSARYRRLTPPRCLPAPRRGGLLRQGRRHQRYPLRLQRRRWLDFESAAPQPGAAAGRDVRFGLEAEHRDVTPPENVVPVAQI